MEGGRSRSGVGSCRDTKGRVRLPHPALPCQSPKVSRYPSARSSPLRAGFRRAHVHVTHAAYWGGIRRALNGAAIDGWSNKS
jgi:hypothetical protein